MDGGFLLFLNLAPVFFIALMVALAIVAPYRKEPGVGSLIAFIASVAWLLATNTAELIAPPGARTILFAKLEYLGFLYIPVAWISFALRYTGWITRTRKSALLPAMVLPALVFLLVLTNDSHGLLWTAVEYSEYGRLSVIAPAYGPLFWALFAYSWTLVGAGSLIVIQSFAARRAQFYRKSLWILCGVLIPAAVNCLHTFHIIPSLRKDFTPIALACAALCFLVGLYVHRILWITPSTRGLIMQQIRVGLLVMDDDGWIVDRNPMADGILGLDPASIGLFAPDCQLVRRIFAEAGFGPGTRPYPERGGQIRDGDRTLAWSTQGALPSGRGCIMTLKDISGQIALESELAAIKNEFIKRDKLASVGQITAGLAHEINNPLSYLQSDARSLALLVDRLDSLPADQSRRANLDEIASIARGIGEGLDRIGNVVQTLLAFSRQGKADPVYREFSLHTGIDATIDMMRAEFRDSIEIHREYGDIPHIWGQRNEINQVVFNILTNAVHAIRERRERESTGGTITIRTASIDGGRAIACEIGNDGVPIPADVAPRVFDLFFTTKDEKWGTGLGLNISRDIIGRHQGKLLLASLDPVVFRIELPVDARTYQS